MEALILSQPDAATSQTADDDFERTTAEAFAQVVAVEEVAEEGPGSGRRKNGKPWQKPARITRMPWTVICQSDQCSEHVSFDAPVPSCSTAAESNLLGFLLLPGCTEIRTSDLTSQVINSPKLQTVVRARPVCGDTQQQSTKSASFVRFRHVGRRVETQRCLATTAACLPWVP